MSEGRGGRWGISPPTHLRHAICPERPRLRAYSRAAANARILVLPVIALWHYRRDLIPIQKCTANPRASGRNVDLRIIKDSATHLALLRGLSQSCKSTSQLHTPITQWPTSMSFSVTLAENQPVFRPLTLSRPVRNPGSYHTVS